MSKDLKKDQKLKVSGVAVKVKDRPVLFAKSFTMDGQRQSVDRRGSSGERQQTARNNGSSATQE